jgi:disulfide bond formation protein DsbB
MGPYSLNALLRLIAITCLVAVGAAVYLQYTFDWRPCPWCILQRVIFVAIAVLCLIASALKSVKARVGLVVATLVLSVLGVASALWQHFMAAKSTSCSLTLADKIVTGLGLDTLWPKVFEVTGSCAEAAVSMAGIPFEFWSLALFVAIAVVAGLLIGRIPREPGVRPSYLR